RGPAASEYGTIANVELHVGPLLARIKQRGMADALHRPADDQGADIVTRRNRAAHHTGPGQLVSGRHPGIMIVQARNRLAISHRFYRLDERRPDTTIGELDAELAVVH